MALVYATADEPDPDGTELLRHVLEQSLGPVDLRTPDGPHPDTEFRAVQAGPVRVTDARVDPHDGDPCQVVRASRHVARDDSELYRVDLPAEGGIIAAQDGRETWVRPGSLAVTDLTRPAAWVLDATRLRTLLVPRRLLPLRVQQVAGLTARSFDADLNGVVDGISKAVVTHHGSDVAHTTRLGSAIVDVLTVVLAAGLPEDEREAVVSPQRALLTRIHAFIEARLGDPALSPMMIAEAHHISPRYLYRLFEAEERSVGGWIRRRRLEQAHRDLLDPSCQLSAAAIGARWGFVSAAHFSRSFRAEFGRSPGAVRTGTR